MEQLAFPVRTDMEMNDSRRLRIGIIGISRRSIKYAILYFIKNQEIWDLVAVCDTSKSVVESFKKSFPDFNTLSFLDVAFMVLFAL